MNSFKFVLNFSDLLFRLRLRTLVAHHLEALAQLIVQLVWPRAASQVVPCRRPKDDAQDHEYLRSAGRRRTRTILLAQGFQHGLHVFWAFPHRGNLLPRVGELRVKLGEAVLWRVGDIARLHRERTRSVNSYSVGLVRQSSTLLAHH